MKRSFGSPDRMIQCLCCIHILHILRANLWIFIVNVHVLPILHDFCFDTFFVVSGNYRHLNQSLLVEHIFVHYHVFSVSIRWF